MFQHFTVFLYISACLLGITGVVFILLLAKKKYLKESDSHFPLKEFVINSFYLGLISFFIFYKEYIMFLKSEFTAFRLIDYILWLGFAYFWMTYVSSLLKDSLMIKLKNLMRIAWFSYILIWLLTTNIISDNYAYYSHPEVHTSLINLNIILVSFVVFINIEAIYKSKAIIKNVLTHKYIISISTILCIFSLWEGLQFIKLYTGIFKPQPWMFFPFDAISILLLLIHVITIVYVYKYALVPSFFQNNEVTETFIEKQAPIKNSISTLSADYHLTQREIEIVTLIYQGFSNSEIADELCISQNTAKHHVYNIFRKFNVNTRVELICFIQG